jgi:thioredoxin reductase (NADPH)
MKQNKIIIDVLIVGAGPVGIFSAYQAGFLGMKSLVVDIQPSAGGQLTALYPYKYIYDIPGYAKIYAKDLVDNLLEQANKYNPQYLFNTEITTCIKNADGSFDVATNNNHLITAKTIIIAGGAGGFGPNKPPIANIEQFEDKSLFYSVQDPKTFTNKKVIIAGGGDSAVDWAIMLAETAKEVVLMHRRDNFRCAPSSTEAMETLVKAGKITKLVPYVLEDITGSNGQIDKIIVKNMLDEVKEVNTDYFLAFFGLARSLGHFGSWGLQVDTVHNNIKVSTPTYESNIAGIFVVGDMANYDHKLKLISVGFAETAQALHYAWRYIFPDKVLHFTHSTSK